MRSLSLKLILIAYFSLSNLVGYSQITERPRPKEWDQLVLGSRFIDRFLPMKGKVLSSDTWGVDAVKPRYIDNGIEDNIWSYWCGSIKKGEDNKYHLFVCAWLESSPKGHSEWPRSYLFDAIGDNLEGPYTLKKMIGKGHNVEAFRAKNGQYVLYVIDGRYVADDINGPWQYSKFSFNPRDRKIIEGLSNLSFAQREDGSYLMVCRGGGMWISQDGLSEYNQITDKRVYPDVEGEFEDPVIWKDHIQYHMIVNDWLGRIAFYLRSKDGINWVVDPGEAYAPGIAFHEDGTKEDWFKYERIRVFQDEYGRAIQANLAVIDTQKEEDLAHDNHSSKQITIPLNPGMLLTILNTSPITTKTKEIKVKITAEEGFDPQKDIDIKSLRFGASNEVNYGRGCSVSKIENSGKDLIVTFDAKGNGITHDEFAPKLIGKTLVGKMIYGYARLPYIDYIEPVLSARAPVFSKDGDKWNCSIEVQNFGQVESKKASVKVEYIDNKNKKVLLASGDIKALQPYAKDQLQMVAKNIPASEEEYKLVVTIYSVGKELSSLTVKTKINAEKTSKETK